MKLRRGCESNGLTLVEVLVMIAVIAVLAVMLVPAAGRAKARAQRIHCVNNLMQIGLSTRQWSIDHSDKYPMQVLATNGGVMELVDSGIIRSYFQVMSNELSTPKALVCPADIRVPAESFGVGFSITNTSYFVGLDANDKTPAMLLFGDRNITNGLLPPNRILVLTTNRPAGWTHELHNRQGNVALGDNSVQGWSDRGMREFLQYRGAMTNRLAIP